jgi:transcription initiation factor TFIIB
MSLRNPRTERETRPAAPLAREPTCPECDGDLLIDEDAARVCDECGLIVDRDDLDRGPNWYRDTEAENRQTGPGRTVTRHDKGLSAQVGYQNKGLREIAETAAQASRLRELASSSKFDSKRERNLAHGFREVQRIATALGLGESLQKQSCVLFETAQKNDLVIGRSIETVGAAAVYGACRCRGRAITFDQIRAVSKVTIERVRRAYLALNTELELPAQPESPQAYVPSIASELNVSDEVRRRARQHAIAAEEAGATAGRSPSAFAAGCLYAAARGVPRSQKLTQARIAEVADVSTATVRSHWKRLENDGLLERAD